MRRCCVPAETARRVFPEVHNAADGEMEFKLRLKDMYGSQWHALIRKENKCTCFIMNGDDEDRFVSHATAMGKTWGLRDGDVLLLSASEDESGQVSFYVEWNSPKALHHVEHRCQRSAWCTLRAGHDGRCRLRDSLADVCPSSGYDSDISGDVQFYSASKCSACESANAGLSKQRSDIVVSSPVAGCDASSNETENLEHGD